jgi:hypothetical protein
MRRLEQAGLKFGIPVDRFACERIQRYETHTVIVQGY